MTIPPRSGARQKRDAGPEAEAEAEASFLGNLLNHASHIGLHPHHRRDADADPEAEAEARNFLETLIKGPALPIIEGLAGKKAHPKRDADADADAEAEAEARNLLKTLGNSHVSCRVGPAGKKNQKRDAGADPEAEAEADARDVRGNLFRP